MIATLNDMEMYWEVHGDGEPLLLLHGFFGSSGDWVHLFDMEALARRYRVITPDLRGHGRSTNPPGTFTHRQSAADVAALLDHLDIARCRAVGVSAGGNTLLHLATQQPERVTAMVLAGATSYFPAEARAIMAMVSPEGHEPAAWEAMRARHLRGDDQIRALWRIANGFKDSHHDMAFTPPLLATIRARTLIVTGDRDPLYPVGIFADQYRAIPNAALFVIPNAGHDAIFGAWRAAFADAALSWLNG
jgi:pimeloyl-ACP methyl ester carboxylesterase